MSVPLPTLSGGRLHVASRAGNFETIRDSLEGCQDFDSTEDYRSVETTRFESRDFTSGIVIASQKKRRLLAHKRY